MPTNVPIQKGCEEIGNLNLYGGNTQAAVSDVFSKW